MSIGKGAFLCCSNLTNINIPESVTSIGNEAFRDCRSLTSIMIPESVTSIGARSFYKCTKLKVVKIPKNCYVEKTAFNGCRESLNIIEY